MIRNLLASYGWMLVELIVLGLAIVERAVKLHGGNVRLLKRDGGGLEVRVELPAEDKRAA